MDDAQNSEGDCEEHGRDGRRTRTASRRQVIALASAVAIGGTAGCLGGGDDTNEAVISTTDESTTEATTEQATTSTTAASDEQGFEEIYDETYDNEEMALYDNQWTSIEDQEWESRSHMFEHVNSLVSRNFTINNDSQEQARLLKRAIHNDLEFDTDEVRVLGRDMAGGGTYTAILHKNDDGDWVKDLALPDDGEEGYLRHDETEDDINFNHETERGLWNIWDSEATGTASATAYFGIKNGFGDREEAKERGVELARERIGKGNDHIVVGEPYDNPTVGYTPEAAQRLAEIQNWHENDTANEEMAVVEEATEAWHNSEEPYIEMQVQDGELTAMPTEEYGGPGQIYEFLRET